MRGPLRVRALVLERWPRTDLHQALDVLGDLLAQVALHPAFVLDDLANALGILFGKIAHLRHRVDLGRRENLARPRPADTVNVSQSDPDLLVLGEVHPCNTRHRRPLPLPLLVLWVVADHPHDARAAHDLALRTDPPD